MVVNSDGTGLVQLTNNDDSDWHPRWSPDGHFITFTSNRDGEFAIYAIRSDGSEPARLHTQYSPIHRSRLDDAIDGRLSSLDPLRIGSPISPPQAGRRVHCSAQFGGVSTPDRVARLLTTAI